MSLINVNLGILVYADAPASQAPNVRLADIKFSLMGLPTGQFQNIPISLAPGQTLTVASTARALSLSGTTQVSVTKNGDKMRVSGAFGQRTLRVDASTAPADIAISSGVVRLHSAATDFSSVGPGDIVSVDAGFSPYNQGDFTVLGTGANFIEFMNPLAQPESAVTGSARVFSPSPVMAGDTLDLTDSKFSILNRGAFPITRVTDQYVEVLNPNVYPQSFASVAGLNIYPFAFKWLAAAVDRKVLIGLNGGSASAVEVEPPVEGDLAKNPGLFIKRGKVFQVTITNPGLSNAQGFLMLAE